jgi:molybdopterin biosynthesis enzyme MoaB
VINLPGTPKAVRECLDVLTPMLPHALKLATGDDGGGGAHAGHGDK